MYKKNKILSFYVSKGNIEILKNLEQNSPMRFTEIRNIVNPKTSKKFSSKTISERLKELETSGHIKNQIITSHKRRTIGYSITQKGKKSLNILKETIEKLEKLN